MEALQELKNGIVDCMSLCDQGNIQGCVDRMLCICHNLAADNQAKINESLCEITNKLTDKLDVRAQKLNNLVEYIESTAWYIDGTNFDTTGIHMLETYITHIAEVEKLDAMDRCYIFTKISRESRIACGAGQIIARGLFKYIEWQHMNTQLQNNISDFMNEQMYKIQGLMNITSGDVHFDLSIKWDELVEKTAEEWSKMFLDILNCQKN